MACSNITLLIEGHYFEDNWGGGGQLVDVANNLNSCTFNINTPFGTTENNVQINKNSNKSFTDGIKVYTIYVTDILQEDGIYGVRFYVCYEGFVKRDTVLTLTYNDSSGTKVGEQISLDISLKTVDGTVLENTDVDVYVNGIYERSTTFNSYGYIILAEDVGQSLSFQVKFPGNEGFNLSESLVVVVTVPEAEGFLVMEGFTFLNEDNVIIDKAIPGKIVHAYFLVRNLGEIEDTFWVVANIGLNGVYNDTFNLELNQPGNITKTITTDSWIMPNNDITLTISLKHLNPNGLTYTEDNRYEKILLYEVPTCPTPIADFTIPKTTYIIGDIITATSTSTPGTGATISEYEWKWDGTIIPGTSTLSVVSIDTIGQSIGTHSIALRVKNSCGNWSTVKSTNLTLTQGLVDITVNVSDGINPIQNAAVKVILSVNPQDEKSCTTNANGTCIIKSLLPNTLYEVSVVKMGYICTAGCGEFNSGNGGSITVTMRETGCTKSFLPSKSLIVLEEEEELILSGKVVNIDSENKQEIGIIFIKPDNTEISENLGILNQCEEKPYEYNFGNVESEVIGKWFLKQCEIIDNVWNVTEIASIHVIRPIKKPPEIITPGSMLLLVAGAAGLMYVLSSKK